MAGEKIPFQGLPARICWLGYGDRARAGLRFNQIVADGTPEAARRFIRVLTTDPGLGIVRHADAGYQEAIEAARRHGIKMPMWG